MSMGLEDNWSKLQIRFKMVQRFFPQFMQEPAEAPLVESGPGNAPHVCMTLASISVLSLELPVVVVQ